jgi:hypothetical protein
VLYKRRMLCKKITIWPPLLGLFSILPLSRVRLKKFWIVLQLIPVNSWILQLENPWCDNDRSIFFCRNRRQTLKDLTAIFNNRIGYTVSERTVRRRLCFTNDACYARKLQWLQYRINHHILVTNHLLSKVKIIAFLTVLFVTPKQKLSNMYCLIQR